MSILTVLTTIPGALPSDPKLVFIDTNDTLASVQVAGYLTAAQAQFGNVFTNAERVLVGTQATANAQTDLTWMNVAIIDAAVSLTPSGASAGGAGAVAGFPSLVSSVPNTKLLSGTSSDIGGQGVGPIVVPLAGLTASSIVLAMIASSSNATTISAITVADGSYSVTFAQDPGASCILNYIAFTA